MANPHFANLGDAWKHLLLTEVISSLRPGHYVETHAGSAAFNEQSAAADAGVYVTASFGISASATG
jgi:23S rRNA A2030 N6-methylase RlmJ